MVPKVREWTEETTKEFEGRPRHKIMTSVNLSPDEHEMLGRLARGLGTSRSKAAGLAIRRYAVEMGLTRDGEGDE